MLADKNLLTAPNRVQVPWVKVTIGDIYTFGVYDRNTYDLKVNNKVIAKDVFGVEYPNYVQNLRITKINGQVNKYNLGISYPITQFDDPNFFEKVFSKASGGRKIVFSYGDINQPGFIYRDEEAIITKDFSTLEISDDDKKVYQQAEVPPACSVSSVHRTQQYHIPQVVFSSI